MAKQKKTHKVTFTDNKGVQRTSHTNETVAKQMKALEGNSNLPWIKRVTVKKDKKGK